MRNPNSTAHKIKARLAFHGVSDANALQQFLAVLQGLKNNPAYPNTPVDIATYEKDVDGFGTLLTDAQDGGKKAISAKDKQRIAVIKMYTLLGHYVESACNDDPATFNTSGFIAVSRTRTAAQPLTGSSFQRIDRGPNSGEIVVRIASLIGAIAYELRYSLVAGGGAPGPSTTLTLTSPRKFTITGLTPAGTYQFQVRALGRLGFNDWSTPMTFICG
jgi:Fibronectin type III domain